MSNVVNWLIDWLIGKLIDWLVRLLPLQYSVENCKLCGSQHNTSHRHYSGKYGQFYVFLTFKHCYETININGFGQILNALFWKCQKICMIKSLMKVTVFSFVFGSVAFKVREWDNQIIYETKKEIRPCMVLNLFIYIFHQVRNVFRGYF